MSMEKRTASFWLPVRTIAQIVRLAAALHLTQGQAITRAIEELARREGLPVEAPSPDQRSARPDRDEVQQRLRPDASRVVHPGNPEEKGPRSYNAIAPRAVVVC